MFLHLREKTKFIRYDRHIRFILTFRRLRVALSVADVRPAFLPIFFMFLKRPVFFCAFPNDSTNFTDCSNFSQRNARRRSIPPLSGVASKKKSTEFDLRGADAVRSARSNVSPPPTYSRTFELRLDRSFFRRIAVKLSPTPQVSRFVSAFFGFRFKGESNGGAHFSRSLSTSERFDVRSVAKKRRRVPNAPRSTFSRLRRASACFRNAITFTPRFADFRATKPMGDENV